MRAMIIKPPYGYQAWDAFGNYAGYWGTLSAAMHSVGEYLETKPAPETQNGTIRKGDIKSIAEATGLGWHVVSAVNQGLRKNEVVSGLLSLAKTNRIEFANALAKEKQATDILVNAGLMTRRDSVYTRKQNINQ